MTELLSNNRLPNLVQAGGSHDQDGYSCAWPSINSKKYRRNKGAVGSLVSLSSKQSGDVIVPPAANAVGLVQEVFSVAESLLRILVDGNYDRLDVLEAIAFHRRHAPYIGQGFWRRRKRRPKRHRLAIES